MTKTKKLYLEAIRALPEEWVDDETMITVWMSNVVVAANPKFAPMKYSDGEWRDIEVAEPSPEFETEKTLRFLKTGRKHD
jgi:hypothetical protein